MNDLVKVDLKPKFEVYDENCTYVKKKTLFTITIPAGETITIEKWILDSDEETESDWDFYQEDDKKAYEALPEELQDEFSDFVFELKL